MSKDDETAAISTLICLPYSKFLRTIDCNLPSILIFSDDKAE